MSYIYFTEEQKLRASEVDLVEFLRCQGEKLIPSGPAEYRLGRDHSVTVRQDGSPAGEIISFYHETSDEDTSGRLILEIGLADSSETVEFKKQGK